MAIASGRAASLPNECRAYILPARKVNNSFRLATFNGTRLSWKLAQPGLPRKSAKPTHLMKPPLSTAEDFMFLDAVARRTLRIQPAPKLNRRCRGADQGSQPGSNEGSWQERLSAVRREVGRAVVGSAASLVLALTPVGQAGAVMPAGDWIVSKTAQVSPSFCDRSLTGPVEYC